MQRVEDCLRDTVRLGDRLVVGLSGGLDSMVLLDVLDRIAHRRRLRLSAVHVNHQLSPNAPTWERFCRRACRERSIPFRCARVDVARGTSLEAAARAARYVVLLEQPAEHVVLAHHQDDQAETVLLQLLRGAGVKGLAAMPQIRIEDHGSWIGEGPGDLPPAATSEEQGLLNARRKLNPQSSLPRPSILRPLLDVPRAEIERYARRSGLSWVEDESNRDTRFARNFVRHQLLPALEERFPSCRATLARSARHMGEAARLLDELAESDAAAACRDAVLAVAALRQLSPARARNLLRWFLGRHGLGMPEAGRLDEILRQTISAKDGARVKVALAAHDLYRWKEGLHVVPRSQPLVNFALEWRGERLLRLPEFGAVLRMAAAHGTGISRAKLTGHPVILRERLGGERMRPDCRRPRRTLQNLFQECGIPPWERSRLPLLWCGPDLVWVPGIGIDCAYRADPLESSITPHWLLGPRKRG